MSPQEMRKLADHYRESAAYLRRLADRREEEAEELERQADADEANPPSTVEKIDRLLGSL